MLMHIRAAKGKKDRMGVLSTKLLLTLRAYFRRFKPPGFTSLRERVAEPIVPVVRKALLRKQNNGPASEKKEAFICFAIVTQPSYWKEVQTFVIFKPCLDTIACKPRCVISIYKQAKNRKHTKSLR
jgi:hypothetical protein